MIYVPGKKKADADFTWRWTLAQGLRDYCSDTHETTNKTRAETQWSEEMSDRAVKPLIKPPDVQTYGVDTEKTDWQRSRGGWLGSGVTMR